MSKKIYYTVVFVGLLLLGASPAHAQYTYTRTFDPSIVNQYMYSISALDTSQTPNCLAVGEAVYKTAAECTAAQASNESSIPATASVINNCGQITQQTYNYTFNSPLCAASASNYGYTPTNSAATTATTATTPSPTTGTIINTTGTGLLQNPLQATDLVTLLNEILGYVIQIGTIFLVLMLIYVGFQFVMAQGNPEKVQSARSALLWTAIGGLLLLGAKALALVIVATVSGL